METKPALAAFLCLYFFALLSVIGLQPFWLDEVIELRVLSSVSVQDLLHHVAENAGGVPLDYLVRLMFTNALGLSRLSARLPSLLSSLAAALGVFALARRSGMRRPAIAVLLFCLFPLQVRYALEARPYETALALSIWATVIFRELIAAPTLTKACAWGVAILLALYTQPFSMFVCFANLIWFFVYFPLTIHHKMYGYVCGPVLAAAAAFIPWHVWAIRVWAGVASSQPHYAVKLKDLPLIAHELTGAGYIGSVLLIGLVIFGFIGRELPFKEASFWLFALVAPVVLATAADITFGYFLAIRQMVFVLTPLALLSAVGLNRLVGNNRMAIMAACMIIGGIFLFANVSRFLRPHEDWESPARNLAMLSEIPNTCIMFLPDSLIDNYAVFAPILRAHKCSPIPITKKVAAVTRLPIADARPYIALSRIGYVLTKTFNFADSRIDLFERTSPR